MPGIPPTIPPAPNTSTTAATTAASGLTAVQVTIADVSQALQNLGHVVQLNATATTAPDNNTLTLATALGNITVSLAQVATAERQNLLQQLLNITSPRPLTLSLQPGSPPTQGVLLIPTSPTPVSSSIANVTASAQPLNVSFPPLAEGQTLTAISLPPHILSPLPVPLTAASASDLTIQYPSLNPQILLSTNPENALTENAPSVVNPVFTQPTTYTPPALAPAASAPLANDPLAAVTKTPLPPPSLGQTQQPSDIQVPWTPAVTSSPPSQQANTPFTSTSFVTTPTIQISAFQPAAIQGTVIQEPRTLAALLQPGNEVTLHIDTLLPRAQNTQPSALPPLAANQVTASVVGTGTNGQLILKTGDAVLFVKTQVVAPLGTNIVVTIDAAKSVPLLTLPTEPIPFEALPQAIAALAQLNPLVFQQMMSAHMPQPTEALPGTLLLLLSAFKQGNLRSWLGGDATDTLLRGGQSNLISSLSRELGGGGQPVQDVVVGEWHSYPIPLYVQQQFQTLTLYVHNDRDGRQDTFNKNSNNKVRFLIDMSLSKLGAMQIDGFVQTKKLDMILRSEIRLPEGMHNNLRASYIKALDAVGYAGTLHFQVGRQHWLTMRKSATQAVVT